MPIQEKQQVYNIVAVVLYFGVAILLTFSCGKESSIKETTVPEVRLSNQYEIREGDSAYRIKFVIDSVWHEPAYDPNK